MRKSHTHYLIMKENVGKSEDFLSDQDCFEKAIQMYIPINDPVDPKHIIKDIYTKDPTLLPDQLKNIEAVLVTRLSTNTASR